MSAQPRAYADVDPETALKYAVQRIKGDRAQIIEGVIEPLSLSWDHENAAASIRGQIASTVRELGCISGSGNLDLPGSSNWYVPDLAVVPRAVAKGGEALLPDQTLLVVEVTSDSNADSDRTAKRQRYAQYGAPLYLLVDRQQRAVTLFALPSRLGYTRVDGPHPFGTPMNLPDPFGLELDTSDL